MDFVRSRLDGQRNDSRGGLAVLRRKSVGDDLELRHGVDGWLDGFLLGTLRSDRLVVVINAVDHEVDLRAALAANRDSLAARDNRAGRDHRKLQVVATVQRKVDDLTVLDHRARRALGGLQQGRGSLDLDHLGDRTDLERDIELAHVTDGQRDARTGICLEAVRLNHHDVRPDTQRVGTVAAGLVRLRRRLDTGFDVAERHVDARNHGPGGIRDRPDDQRRIGLLSCRKRHQSQKQDKSRDKAALSFHHEVPSLENKIFVLHQAQHQRTPESAAEQPLSQLICSIRLRS